jgi:hypothetical protein
MLATAREAGMRRRGDTSGVDAALGGAAEPDAEEDADEACAGVRGGAGVADAVSAAWDDE